MGLRDFLNKGEERPIEQPRNTATSQQSLQPEAKHYTVASGDSLSKIAEREYGDVMHWRKIYEANKETIGDNPDLIHPGQDLVIPAKSAPTPPPPNSRL